jgi:dolichyl-diphosphooligosaccharide--protein glycosyltransferase
MRSAVALIGSAMRMATGSRAANWAVVLLVMVLVGWIRLLPQSLGIADDWADDWIRRHPAQLQADRAAIAQQVRAELTYTGEDGREYPYLGDFDSYLWLRHARTYLRTGTPCGAVADGACRDTYTNAPVGARTIYARSLHVAAIAGLHDIIRWFRPAHPLPASAFLVQVVVGVLGVLPAFFIARGLAGTAAGAFAGVLTAVHPFLLTRTLGSDNDTWNTVLPLYMLWATMAALAARTALRGALWAGLAGIAVGLQAWAWRGWPFFHIVLMTGLAGAALLHGTRYGLRHRTPRIWQAPDLPRIGLVLLVVHAVAGAGASLVGSEDSYLAIPARAAEAVLRAVAGNTPPGGSANDWPSALTRVAELAPLRLRGIARVAGTTLFLAGLVGLLLLTLPEGRWRWWHRAILGAGAAVYSYALIGMEPGRLAALALLGAPLGAALIAGLWSDDEPHAARRGVALVVVVWFLAAVATAHDGLRFVLLLVPPLGIAAAVAAGRLETWIRGLISVMPGWYRTVGAGVLGVVVALALLHPLEWGYTTARRYTPSMHDAWWDALTHLRRTAHPDAIVHTWWDFGHWVTYVADRRVSNDGTSLVTHVPHWLGRALVAPGEAESVGVLRMLACGSDATPLPEGSRGAYGKLLASGRDPAGVYGVLSDLVALDVAAAEAYLARHGLTQPARAGILQSSHCEPPEGYLVLSSALISRRRSWMSFGLWDPRGGIGLTPGEAPSPVPFVSHWLPCRAGREGGQMVCDIDTTMSAEAPLLQSFSYRPDSPEDSRLQSRTRRGDALSDTTTVGTPAALLLAGAEDLRGMGFASPTYPDLAVLVDIPGARILVGALPLLQSTYVHLMYLDGRYARHYRKHDDRMGRGERVVTWKIDWKAR